LRFLPRLLLLRLLLLRLLLRRLLLLRWLLLRRLLLLRWLLLRRLLLLRLPVRLMAWRPPFVNDGFVGDEFVAVPLQNRAGEGRPPTTKMRLSYCFSLVDQRDEVAVAADDGERVDVIVRERHFQRIQRQVDVRAVLVSSR